MFHFANELGEIPWPQIDSKQGLQVTLQQRHLNDLQPAAQLGLPAARLDAPPPPRHAPAQRLRGVQLLLPGHPHVAQHHAQLPARQPRLRLLLLRPREQPLARAGRRREQLLHSAHSSVAWKE